MNIHGRHKSLETHVKRSIAWLSSISSVTKIVIGFSESCRHRYPPGFIRWRIDEPGGFKVNAYSGRGVTDIYVKIDPISNREQVKELITKRFNNQEHPD